jgi:hypothetical protein
MEMSLEMIMSLLSEVGCGDWKKNKKKTFSLSFL